MVRTTVLKVDDHAIEGPMLALLSYSQSDLFRDIPFNRILYGVPTKKSKRREDDSGSSDEPCTEKNTNLPNQKMMLHNGANQQQQSIYPQKLQCTQYTPPPKEYAEELQKALLIE
ncbi:hypothetical protein Bca4012_068950 [Brassica carinata]